MKIELTPEEAGVVRHVLERQTFQALWFQREEAAVCANVAAKIKDAG